MRVYVTKYALTDGISVRMVDRSDAVPSMVTDRSGPYTTHFRGEGREWHRTPESALKRAEEMRRKKIASLKKSLAHMEAMKFEVPA